MFATNVGVRGAFRKATVKETCRACSMSRLQRSVLQLLASAVLIVVVYIVATPKPVPRSALLQPAAVMDNAAPAHKGLDPRAAQLLLAQLDRGRHQQKTRSTIHPLLKSQKKYTHWYKCGNGLCWRGHVPKRGMLDDDDEDDDDDLVRPGNVPMEPTEGNDAGSDDDEGDDADDDDLDLGGCALPDSDDPDYASKMQKIENGEIFCCPSDGQWKPMGADCADPEEAKQPTW